MTPATLTKVQERLRAFREWLREDIGLETVAAVLRLTPEQARVWIFENGDPTQDAKAGLALARHAGVDERSVSLSALREQRPDGRLDPLYLAVSICRLVAEALLAPQRPKPGQPGRKH